MPVPLTTKPHPSAPSARPRRQGRVGTGRFKHLAEASFALCRKPLVDHRQRGLPDSRIIGDRASRLHGVAARGRRDVFLRIGFDLRDHRRIEGTAGELHREAVARIRLQDFVERVAVGHEEVERHLRMLSRHHAHDPQTHGHRHFIGERKIQCLLRDGLVIGRAQIGVELFFQRAVVGLLRQFADLLPACGIGIARDHVSMPSMRPDSVSSTTGFVAGVTCDARVRNWPNGTTFT